MSTTYMNLKDITLNTSITLSNLVYLSLKITRSVSPLDQDSNPTIYARFRKIGSKLRVKTRHFQQSSGRNTKRNNLLLTVFISVQSFILVDLICKFKDDWIKTERVMLMIKSIIGFFNNQGDGSL